MLKADSSPVTANLAPERTVRRKITTSGQVGERLLDSIAERRPNRPDASSDPKGRGRQTAIRCRERAGRPILSFQKVVSALPSVARSAPRRRDRKRTARASRPLARAFAMRLSDHLAPRKGIRPRTSRKSLCAEIHPAGLIPSSPRAGNRSRNSSVRRNTAALRVPDPRDSAQRGKNSLPPGGRRTVEKQHPDTAWPEPRREFHSPARRAMCASSVRVPQPSQAGNGEPPQEEQLGCGEDVTGNSRQRNYHHKTAAESGRLLPLAGAWLPLLVLRLSATAARMRR